MSKSRNLFPQEPRPKKTSSGCLVSMLIGYLFFVSPYCFILLLGVSSGKLSSGQIEGVVVSVIMLPLPVVYLVYRLIKGLRSEPSTDHRLIKGLRSEPSTDQRYSTSGGRNGNNRPGGDRGRYVVIFGHARVTNTFILRHGLMAAGCDVISGNLVRSARVRILRKNAKIFEGNIESLRCNKIDVSEVASANGDALV